MTFGEMILNLRRRLQDLRLNSGQSIATASQDGIRWSAQVLADSVNIAIMEAVRLINAYPNSPFAKVVGLDQFVTEKSVSYTNGVIDLSSITNLINVLSVVVDGIPYSKITIEDYTNYTTLIPDKVGVDANQNVYATYTDTTSGNVPKIKLSKSSGTAVITFTYAKYNYGLSDIATVLPLIGVDDVILDIAERNCRDMEHNWDRSKILDGRILFKFGFMESK